MINANPAGSPEMTAIGSPERIKILMYHRIVKHDRVNPRHRIFAINVDDFRNQLRILERYGFTAITLADYHLFLGGELNLPKKPVIITFDDGYRDTYELAFPALREYGMTAVVFVVADPKIRYNYWDNHDGYPPAQLMTPEQMVELHAAGWEIGSHSLTHPRLAEICRDTAWEEISRSRMVLEMLLNAPVRSFAYPYGQVNEGLKDLVHQAGYAFGCGVYSGPASFGTDLFNIRRITPSAGNLSIPFWSQISLPYERVAWMRWKINRLVRRHGTVVAGFPENGGANAA
jgi:peptidoglycan/xylan/chitin deacetylase (PgdA/CDA1 family)